jgi:predicted outer membrane repeat protein
VNGPAACIIDCQGQGRAFSLTQGENSSARIDGLTLQNGAAVTGGLIRIGAASPTIVNCSFRHGYAQQKGGAIHASNSNCVISHCFFEGNHAGPSTAVDTGGGALMLEIGAPRVSFCRFEQNSADGKGGAVLVKAVATAASIISHCEFRMNTANTGGALFATAPNQTALSIVNSLFAGNAANQGGAIALDHAAGKIALCTFSSNAATLGGALHVAYGTSGGWKLSNSILWGNGSTQIAMEQTSALLDVSYCDIKGGQASVSPGTGTLVWGPGNIDSNPMFVDSGFRLGSASPCLDAGDNVQVPLDVLDLDGDGNAVEQLPFDLSALPRFIELPAIPNTGNGPRPLVDLGCQERQTP